MLSESPVPDEDARDVLRRIVGWCADVCEATTIDAASDEKLRELVALLVERVETADRQVARVVWTAPARPFFVAAAAGAEELALLGEAPPDGLPSPVDKHPDPLAWYAGPLG